MSAGDLNRTDKQAHLKVFQRLVEEGFSGGDTAVVDEVCADDFVEHQDGIEPHDRAGLKGAIVFLHTLSPDIEVNIEDATVNRDMVWARLKGRGTHSGPIMGGPTGRSFEITIMDVCRFRDGKIVEHWGVADRLAQMQQLGIIPRPGSAPAAPGGGQQKGALVAPLGVRQ